MAILNIDNVKKVYGKDENATIALNGVSFQVEEGEFVAIVGTSGSGKTTLLQIIGGINTATSGTVEVQGHKLNDMNKEQITIFRRRNVGFIFQNYNLIPYMDVKDNITFPVELDGKRVDDEWLHTIVEVLSIHNKLDSMPNTLSGGQQQRVAIARAIISKPAIILADEPTGNLDSQSKLDVMELLRITSQKFNQTILMITHDIHLAQLAQRIIQIEDGKIVAM